MKPFCIRKCNTFRLLIALIQCELLIYKQIYTVVDSTITLFYGGFESFSMNYKGMKKEQLLNELQKLKQRIAELEASERRYRDTLESIGDAVSIQDTDYKILYQNRAHKKIMGDKAGQYCYAAYQQKDTVCENCHLQQAFHDGRVHIKEQSGKTAQGPVYVEIIGSPLTDENGRIIAGIETVRNITERKKYEHELRLAEAKFRSLVDQSLVGICIIQNNRFAYINPKTAEIFGYTPDEMMSAVSLEDIIVDEDWGPVKENIRKRIQDEVATVRHTFRAKKKDGSIIEVEAQGTRTEFNDLPAIIGTVIDITEHRKIEAERSKIQKLESLAVFSSGIAHEYNNLLTAILGNLSLAKMYAKPGYEVYDVLMEAEKASVRARDLTFQLLTFAEGSKPAKKVLYLEKSLKNWVESALQGTGVTAEYSFQQDLYAIEADEKQIHQVIDNIAVNASQAMSESGVLQVRAENLDLDSLSELPLTKGKYVRISLEDKGAGISADQLPKIFDPFYTTKQKNAGLGLASSYTIIKLHNGHIVADSHPETGTIFHIYLPAIEKTASRAGNMATKFPKEKNRILVMDDEEIVRLVITKLLAQCGFDAELVSTGEEMLEKYKMAMESGQPFVAVIMDLIIEGGMGGQEAIKLLLETDPHAKAIVSSGYSNAPSMSHFKEFGFSGFLAKPYNLEDLRTVLSAALTGREK